MNFADSSFTYHFLNADPNNAYQREHRKKTIFGVSISLITLMAVIALGSKSLGYVLSKKHQLSTSSTTPITLRTQNSHGENREQPSAIFCVHHQFRINTDILYSFDCSNATDDMTGTYNGIPALLRWLSHDSEAARSMLPVYAIPDYSGQGAAMKLNSSIKYQYIQLEHSPIFFDQTFTISVWLYPDVHAPTIYALLSQTYVNAPALIFSIINGYAVMHVYYTNLRSSTKLKNFQWQHVTFAFAPSDLWMAIHIDGILNAEGLIEQPIYGNFEIRQTTIGSYDVYNQYNGIMDQLSIAFRIKSPIEILDEATLVAHYDFEDDFLFNDISVNSIRVHGSHVSRLISNRRENQGTLSLDNPMLSYFQSGGFVLLSNHNYSYSYALWLNISTISSFMPLVHLVSRPELPSLETNTNTCLAMLTMNRTEQDKIQLSVYIYESGNQSIITSTASIAYSTWFHVVVMSGTNSFSLYVNGILVAVSTGTNTTVFESKNQQRLTLTIGNPDRGAISGDFYSSMCNTDQTQSQSDQSVIGADDLRFYSRELKLTEIQALAMDDPDPTSFFF